MDFADLFMALMGNEDTQEYQFEEIKKLDSLLTEANIPHDFIDNMGGYQITYYGTQGKPKIEPGVIQGSGVGAICSAIENKISYGHQDDLIEISGLLSDEELENDSVKGYLTAEEVFNRIKMHWNTENK